MAFPLIGSLATCRLSFLSDRWHPAGCLSYRIAGNLPALLLMERWSPDRLSLSFLPAARLPMPPGMVAFHGFPSYRIAGIPAARQPMMASHVRATYTPNSKFLKYLFSKLYFLH
jgi:hypothetical protein